ncbi:uncharacterized protein LOC106054202 isoform X2 [Biomphalaria glabrata]|nr:uncharacterized protein LOC106054202 isoform X2 [Biomphalaria glabrata]
MPPPNTTAPAVTTEPVTTQAPNSVTSTTVPSNTTERITQINTTAAQSTSPPDTTNTPYTNSSTAASMTTQTISTPQSTTIVSPSSVAAWPDMTYRYFVPMILMDSSTDKSDLDISISTTSSNVTYIQLRIVSSSVTLYDRRIEVTNYSPIVLTNFSYFLTLETNSTSVCDTLVHLLASDPIYVLLFHKHSDLLAATMASISPISSANYWFIISVAHPENQTFTGFESYIAVVAVENATLVSLAFPLGRLPRVSLKINRIEVAGPRQGLVLLDSMQTLLVVSGADMTGTLVNCSRPVVVFAGAVTDSAGGRRSWALEQLVPAPVSSLVYVTFPSLNLSSEAYRIVAVHSDTTVQVPHVVAQDPTSGEIYFKNAGDAVDLDLTSADLFHVILADKPVQVHKFIWSTLNSSIVADACNLQLVSPRSNNISWMLAPYLTTRSDLLVHLFIITWAFPEPEFLMDGNSLDMPWRNLTEGSYRSNLKGAYLKVDTQHHWVSLNQSEGNFSAYLVISGPGIRMCTSLSHVISQMSTDVYGDWTLCGEQVIKSGFDVLTTTTESQTTTTESQTTEVNSDGVSSDMTTALTSLALASASTTQSTSGNRTVDCNFCWKATNLTLNLTKEELDSVLEAIRAQLFVNHKLTSAYRRSLECAQDFRPVSNGIGFVGITFCISVIFCVIVTDLSSFGRMCRKTVRNDSS